MKTLLLVLFGTLFLFSNLFSQQIIVNGVSPGSIAGAYNFTWADPGGFDWSTPDFNIPGTFVQDTLMLVEDGTPGTSSFGHPLSNEGCNTLTNNLNGKIAVVYRGGCEFSMKALMAQNAGAVGVIIINHSGDPIGMGGGTEGLNVTIPVVMISTLDGANIIAEMGNGPVVMFLGNVFGAYPNNLSLQDNALLISPYGGAYSAQFDGFNVGAYVFNYGANNQNNISLTATIVGPSGTVYNQTSATFSLNTGDTMWVGQNGTITLPPFNLGGPGNYPLGDYTLSYTINSGVLDDFPSDNSFSSDFSVSADRLSRSKITGLGEPIANSYPSSFTNEYQACSVFKEDNFNGVGAKGVYFIPFTDTTINNPVGAEIYANVYEWNDAFSDISDPNFGWNNLNPVGYGSHIISSNSEMGLTGYIQYNQPVSLSNSQRYLVCLQTFDDISFGFDASLSYSGNESITLQPTSSISVDNTWYMNWTEYPTPSIVLDLNCPWSVVSELYTQNSCPGGNSGEIAIDTSGFVGNTTILWSNGGTNDTISNLAPGNYSVSVSDGVCAVTKDFIINESPQQVITLTGMQETCPATNDGTASLVSHTNGVPPFSYSWSNGDNTMSTSGLDAGTYYLTVTDSEGCSVTESVTIGSGTVNFPLAVQANPTAGTSPLNVIFDNQTPNLSGYNFTWVFGDGTSEQNNASFVQHTYIVNGLWDVVLIAEDITTGCTDTLFLDDFIFSTGGASCTHSATINQSGPITICQGDSTLLTCNNNAGFSYQWNKNGVAINGANNDSLYVYQSGNYSVTIFENNCPVVSSSISVIVNSVTTPLITGTGTITSCSGGSITLNAGAGYASYLWSTGGTAQTEIITTSGNYTVTVSSANGCTATSAPYIVNASFMNQQEVCIVGVDSLTNFNRVIWEKPITSGIDSFYVYREGVVAGQFDKIGATDYPDIALFIDQNSNPAVQAYRYKVSILDTCGTETPLGDFHKTIHLTINQGVGQTWNLIWSHYEGFSFPSYNIYRGTSPSNMSLLTTIASNLNSYTDLNPPGGTTIYYQIEVVSNGTCDPNKKMGYGSSLSNIANTGINGLESIYQNNEFKVVPNPNNGVFNILAGNDDSYQVQIHDLKGKLIFSTSAQGNQMIDISDKEAGVYFVQCATDKESQIIRIIKQ